MEERLKEQLKPAGVSVDNIYFSLSYSQGDYATFDGHIEAATWMETRKDGPQDEATPTFAEKYPALYLAMQDYGERVTVDTRYRSCTARVSMDCNVVGNTYPTGIFQHLDQEAWDELVEEQFAAAKLEAAMQEYVNDISNQLYRDLQAEYEHLTSEESFIESCEANDETFELEEEECEV